MTLGPKSAQVDAQRGAGRERAFGDLESARRRLMPRAVAPDLPDQPDQEDQGMPAKGSGQVAKGGERDADAVGFDSGFESPLESPRQAAAGARGARRECRERVVQLSHRLVGTNLRTAGECRQKQRPHPVAGERGVLVCRILDRPGSSFGHDPLERPALDPEKRANDPAAALGNRRQSGPVLIPGQAQENRLRLIVQMVGGRDVACAVGVGGGPEHAVANPAGRHLEAFSGTAQVGHCPAPGLERDLETGGNGFGRGRPLGRSRVGVVIHVDGQEAQIPGAGEIPEQKQERGRIDAPREGYDEAVTPIERGDARKERYEGREQSRRLRMVAVKGLEPLT